MTEEQLIEWLEQTGARRYGHFRLTTGLHSGEFFLLAQLFQHPTAAAAVGAELAVQLRNVAPDATAVVGPAMGGVLLAHEVAKALGARSMFAERVGEGGMRLRRGFQLAAAEQVIVVEDAVTTGSSVRLAMAAVEQAGGRVAAVGAVVDRSDGQVSFGVPLRSLLRLNVAAYPPENCPLCAAGEPLVAPKV